MTDLNKDPNIADPDGFYAELLAAHEGLDEAASHALNARLVLIMANHIGDRRALSHAELPAQRSRATSLFLLPASTPRNSASSSIASGLDTVQLLGWLSPSSRAVAKAEQPGSPQAPQLVPGSMSTT